MLNIFDNWMSGRCSLVVGGGNRRNGQVKLTDEGENGDSVCGRVKATFQLGSRASSIGN